ncbi:hypothetical protein POM88_051265 [Heracleum sosnowskyi]|uniref:Uncharacterized protein n=1 Tax=Heracleum sosnowskyi TaxID=360622 RepID=A0AAD8M388_9APIA|nr:hypothetical protein POM88_051265 [Heracleum sosnowskyi]
MLTSGTSQIEDKRIPCSSKNLAQTKKEQDWGYDPTIKYEALRQCAVPIYTYHNDSATDWTESSDSELEIETMTEKAAQTQKDQILTEAREEQPFFYSPTLNYDVLKQFYYIDSPDSLAYSNLILESDPLEEVQPKVDKFFSETTQKQLYVNEYKTKTETEKETETETATENRTEIETETMAEEGAHNGNILAGTKDKQLFGYDPSIKYEPLKRYIVPRFAFFDSSSTDWSDSSSSAFSDSESETEIKAKKDAQSDEDKIVAGPEEKQLLWDDLVESPTRDLQSVAKSPLTKFQSKPAVLNPSFLVNHGAKSPAEVADKVLKQAEEMDSYTEYAQFDFWICVLLALPPLEICVLLALPPQHTDHVDEELGFILNIIQLQL